ncbi:MULTISPECIES: hypothetical protein [unclassified Streptomyces]|uniref:hypothetical protein n=1 Tax=unclassified Streptomyces TaxID=2593676 RepID=UPI0036F6FE02
MIENGDREGPDGLLGAADSPSWAVRAAAGRRLAASADMPGVEGVLRRLLLDEWDTAVTQETAEALLERRDAIGLRLVLGALAVADDDTADELDAALACVFQPSGDAAAQLELLCGELASDLDAGVRREAATILLRLRPSSG